MNATLDACLRSWPWDPWLVATCVVSLGIYLRGYRRLARHDPGRWHPGQPAALIGGMLSIYLALASPIEPMASLLLQVHMVQHLLLMMLAPPLFWLADPLLPMLWGLPESLRKEWAAPLLRWTPLRRLARRWTHPLAALPIFVLTSLVWHVPACYELALRSPAWHYAQHVCFFAAGLLFWHPVVRPYPSRPQWSTWLLLPYLLLADVQNTILSAVLAFSGKVLYPYYAEMPRLANLTALEDQSAAGVIMWVPGSIAFLGPLAWIGLQLLSGAHEARARRAPAPRPALVKVKPRATLAILQPSALQPEPAHVSWFSSFLRWRHARLVFQIPLLLAAMFLIYDGLRGPQASPLNLAGVLPWIHWRGLLVLGLLSVGNLSCMACPFTLPRKVARRWLPQQHDWPTWLRSKWLAVALIALFLWGYEAFALWDSPWWTAWIALGYFAAAFAIDGYFRGAAFCKYVCPIGQFNFVQSLVSPVEVGVHDPQICTTCRTKDCLRGRDGIPGCELDLFQPKKSSNMDCTFCLDCVQACPQANVGLILRAPGSNLWSDRLRSGIGRWSTRPDLAALILVLVFGAFANAGGMVAPVVGWQLELQNRLELSPRAVVTLYYVLAIAVAPLLAIVLASTASRALSGSSTGLLRTATRYAFALVPLGFSMWLAHYSFHLFTSYATVVPATQRLALDLGVTALGEPQWSCACCTPAAAWLLRAELLALDFGFLLSMYAAWRIASAESPRRPLAAFLPWSVVLVLLFLTGVWIVFQPMQMRGTLGMGG